MHNRNGDQRRHRHRSKSTDRISADDELEGIECARQGRVEPGTDGRRRAEANDQTQFTAAQPKCAS
jgi:hypothetical protein